MWISQSPEYLLRLVKYEVEMKIARYTVQGNIHYGVLEGDVLRSIAGSPWDAVSYTGIEHRICDAKLLSPVIPPDVFAIGLNYKPHADEAGFKYPPAPVLFIKAASSVMGPGDDIVLPAMAPDEVDCEAELVIVIGKTCRKVPEENALDYVLGYTCGNDVSARDCQFKLDTQWARAKSFETFCPLGPWIETDFDPDDVQICIRLNDKVMQQSSTSEMIFSCRQLVSYLSHVVTLRPGSVIMTGTPSGVGYTRKPPVFLRPGDRVEVEIEGIGALSNGVVEEVKD